MSLSPLPLLICEHCQGTGKIAGRRCSFCATKSIGLFSHNRFLFWSWPLSGYEIAYRSFKHQLDKIINLLLGVGVVLILTLIAVYFWGSSQFSGAQIWLILSQPQSLNIWLALVIFAILYLVARLIRLQTQFTDVAKHGFSDVDENIEPRAISWAEIRQFKRDQQQELSSAYSAAALQVIESAYLLAAARREPQVNNFHIFKALLQNNEIQGLLVRLLISTAQFNPAIDKIFPAPASTNQPQFDPLPSTAFWQTIFQSYEEAWRQRSAAVEVTDLLITCVAAEESLRDLLFDFGVTDERLHNVVQWVRVRARLLHQQNARVRGSRGRARKGDTNRAMTALATPYLNSFSQDITKASLFGYLEPRVGRETETESIFRILQGGGMSVLLVGNHGVGKRTIINGIAELMVAENVPAVLQDKRLVELDVARLLAGAGAAEAQERLLTILYELEQAGNIILVIPGIEKMVGITAGQEQSLDVAGVLTTELSKGFFLTIATTSPEAYNKAIANQALGAVFQKIDVDEMDANSAIQVLEAKAGYIEYKHEVWFAYEALERAVLLAQRYLHDSYLPAKAIELCNEAALLVRNKQGKNALVRAEDVATVIAERTKIPVTAVSEGEGEKLMRLEAALHNRVVGQEEAVTLVSNALRRARAEIRSGKRPIANFLFLGPTGVGKTELTKTIAEVYFGSEKQMIRLDMSEYQDTTSIYRLIGRPGEQGTGMLTEAVRQQPFSLLLLDELEKADPNILNLFLQVMDDGRLTDSVGRIIDFTNVILIATSNAGTQYVQEQMRGGVGSEQIKNQLIHGELKQYFKPEFLNRFDAIVLFHALQQTQIAQIARMILIGLGHKLEERGIFLEVTDAAVAELATAGFDPEFGARPLRRVIQDRVENAIAGLLLQNQVKRKDTIVIDVGGITVRPAA